MVQKFAEYVNKKIIFIAKKLLKCRKAIPLQDSFSQQQNQIEQ